MRPLLNDLYFYDEVVRIGWCDPVAASAADRGWSPVPPGSTTPHVLRAEQSGMFIAPSYFSSLLIKFPSILYLLYEGSFTVVIWGTMTSELELTFDVSADCVFYYKWNGNILLCCLFGWWLLSCQSFVIGSSKYLVNGTNCESPIVIFSQVRMLSSCWGTICGVLLQWVIKFHNYVK
jgi:hypothetical protein